VGGTILNVITVALGTTLGIFVGHRLTAKIQESVVTGLGLVTLFVGLSNANMTGNVIIPLLSLVIGVIIGELVGIDALLERFGAWLQARFAGKTSGDSSQDSAQAETAENARQRFITGFVTASLVFCVGPLTFVGSIQDGMGLAIGYQQLAIKSVLDMFAGMAFAASFGIGVGFSIITIIVLQGGLALIGMVLARVGETVLEGFVFNAMVNEMTAVGGLLLIALSLVLLDVKKPRVANFLPALVIAPLLVALGSALGINIYPL
jgi:uncharacterized membrane protein YqgA involved in biofilm formation